MFPEYLAVPRLLGSFDDGEWVALVIESIDGVHPRETLPLTEILAVLSALESLPKIRGCARWAGVPDATAELAGAFAGWRSIRSEGRAESLPACAYEFLDELEQLAASAARIVHRD
jgi:hypothetical protein